MQQAGASGCSISSTVKGQQRLDFFAIDKSPRVWRTAFSPWLSKLNCASSATVLHSRVSSFFRPWCSFTPIASPLRPLPLPANPKLPCCASRILLLPLPVPNSRSTMLSILFLGQTLAQHISLTPETYPSNLKSTPKYSLLTPCLNSLPVPPSEKLCCWYAPCRTSSQSVSPHIAVLIGIYGSHTITQSTSYAWFQQISMLNPRSRRLLPRCHSPAPSLV